MSKITLFKGNKPAIGLYTRTATLGDEYSFVEQFIEYYCHSFTKNNKKTRLAVFVEPRIKSGFPDVVFASYLPSIIDNWSDNRDALEVVDLKILSHLCGIEVAKVTTLISQLGFPENQTLVSLKKLMDAKLISYRDHNWRVREMRNVFSLTKLIAVEAKLNNINRVVDQTHLNTWFASHSYALTNTTHPREATIKKFSRYGLGLYCKGKRFHRIVKARQLSLPSSYLSFQFNEWIGKSIAHQGVVQYA
jgi:hypothetical protein